MVDSFAPVLPLRIAAATLRVDSASPGWELLEPGVDRARVCVTRVLFEHAFHHKPVVHVGLAAFDIENGDAARLRVGVGVVDGEGFEVRVETWFETKVWSVEISWFAIGH